VQHQHLIYQTKGKRHPHPHLHQTVTDHQASEAARKCKSVTDTIREKCYVLQIQATLQCFAG
jgi:hypothetical protein